MLKGRSHRRWDDVEERLLAEAIKMNGTKVRQLPGLCFCLPASSQPMSAGLAKGDGGKAGSDRLMNASNLAELGQNRI